VSFLAAAVLYLLAVGGVQGFAFTLGLTTLVDVAVVFLFTHPVVALLSRTKFFGGGHKLSGFDAEHLGRAVVYTGRGTSRPPSRRRGGPAAGGRRAQPASAGATLGDDSTAGLARTGTTIAERRAAERRALLGEAGSGADDGDPVIDPESRTLQTETAGDARGSRRDA
jgi:preprotein translocase subunit SecD